ncbi:MAG: Rieske (2Fe-2S) protein [Planctomycetes bacterium]|nr:Rieske (2Fe-2S) protein [Planctomycetota bacterium]
MALHKVAALSHLPPGAALRVTVEAREIGLFNFKGEILAIKNLCPHMGDQLHKGQVTDAGRVVCPGHAWHFDLKTGACTSGQTDARVRTYPVVIQDNDIYIEV